MPMSPGAAAKVPLPASPMKQALDQRSPAKSPANLGKTYGLVQEDSPDSREYNRRLQAELAKDMGAVKLGSSPMAQTKPQLGQSALPSQEPVRKLSSIQIPEIPPFKGNPGRGPVLQKMPHQPAASPSRPAGQHPLPEFPSKVIPSMQQQPLPSFQPPESQSQQQPRRSTESTTSAASSSTSPFDAANELTALNSVILPALQSALNRRTHSLKELCKTKPTNSAAAELRERQQYAHEKIRKLVVKAAGLFNEIEKRDDEASVGMGGEVTSFLEGFLEEVLVRVEAADDDGK